MTNLGTSSRAVVHFYNKRGTAEQWIKEGKQAAALTRLFLSPLSRQRGAAWAEPDRLQPRHFVATAGAADAVATWSPTSLQQRLVKTGGQLIQHARYYCLMLAESHLTRRLFAGVLAKIAMLPSPADKVSEKRSRFR